MKGTLSVCFSAESMPLFRKRLKWIWNQAGFHVFMKSEGKERGSVCLDETDSGMMPSNETKIARHHPWLRFCPKKAKTCRPIWILLKVWSIIIIKNISSATWSVKHAFYKIKFKTFRRSKAEVETAYFVLEKQWNKEFIFFSVRTSSFGRGGNPFLYETESKVALPKSEPDPATIWLARRPFLSFSSIHPHPFLPPLDQFKW